MGSSLHPSATETSLGQEIDRKSTRLNSSHSQISYAVFCLKKKKEEPNRPGRHWVLYLAAGKLAMLRLWARGRLQTRYCHATLAAWRSGWRSECRQHGVDAG